MPLAIQVSSNASDGSRYSRGVRDNTKAKLDRGPKGTDQRALTVESARFSVDAIDFSSGRDSGLRTGSRPTHANGLYLKGRFVPSDHTPPFTASVFTESGSRVTARLSPMVTGAKDGCFDLHGIAVRIQSGSNEADLTDLVALNTQPFMFRTADEFAWFLSRMKGDTKQRLIGFGAFGLAAAAGNASFHGLANAAWAIARANRPLLGRNYWGIHTFFADRQVSWQKEPTVRIPYRYRIHITTNQPKGTVPSQGKVLGKYCDIAQQVRGGTPLYLSLWFDLPWRWERLTDWDNVPRGIRDGIINPQAVWKNTTTIFMGVIVLDVVADDNALHGRCTAETYDMMEFDPTRLTGGLHPSEDPMLRARSGIYAESHMRRA